MHRLETYSTAGCARAEHRLAYWNDLAASTLGPIEIEAADGGGRGAFEATLKRVRLRDLDLIAPTSAPATIRTGAYGPACGMLNLQVQRSGRSSTRVGERVATLEAGDFMLFDPSAASVQQFAECTAAIIVRLPVAGAEGRVPGLHSMVGMPVRGSAGAGAVLSQFIRTAWSELEAGADLDWADSLCEVVWPLVDMAYAGVREAPAALTRAARLKREILDYAEAHCLDPGLTAARIADAVGVSARYVQMAFAQRGTTPSAYVRARRLEHAARRLADPAREESITTVALDAGFGDLSTFCRLFRSRFGVAPRDYRAGRRHR